MELMKKKKDNLIDRLTRLCVELVQRFLPDPFIFCLFLTFLMFIASVFIADLSLDQALTNWNGGFWSLLTFSMQMALILVFGHSLACSPPISRLLIYLASLIKSPGQGILVVSFISLFASWVNWGFGLVIGAIFAKEVAKRVRGIDYRLLIASAYSGFLIWHGGLSGSVPLSLATSGNLSQVTKGALSGVISVSQTLFSPLNLSIVFALFVTIPILNYFMHPKEGIISIDSSLLEEDFTIDTNHKESLTFAGKLEQSSLIAWMAFFLGGLTLFFLLLQKDFKLNLNTINFIFLFLAIVLHGNIKSFLNATKKATAGASGILIQFPFYGGIMGLMSAVGSEGYSVAALMSQFFVDISNETTFPLFTFLSAGLVNFFVPSGGGQWAVQAPIMLPAANELGISLSKTALAIAWGDAWTNMIQPFWALPALAIAGLSAKDIMGYCLMTLMVSGFLISSFLLFF